MNPRALIPIGLALAFLVRPTLGIIVINPNETECQAPPPDGAPWNYVARLDNQFGARASGVYLGNRYVLTANHIDADITTVFLNGVNYPRDEGFAPIVIKGTDMRVLRVTNDPRLAPLPLIAPIESELNQPCTMIGYGLGKGTEVPNRGWKWGGDATRLKRWAANTTLKSYAFDVESHASYIQTTFDIAAGPRTGQIAGGDSGCGLFVKLNGVWKLVGIGNHVDADQEALYDNDPATPGNQPDHGYFVSVRPYAAQLTRIRGD